ncbi:MAG: hypothetical protein WAZ19_11110 [Anaerolineae bacterium]
MSLDKDLIQLARTTNDWQIIYSLLRENALVRMVIAGREIVDEALAMFFANDAEPIVRNALAANEEIKFTDDLIMVLVHDREESVRQILANNSAAREDVEKLLHNVSYKLVHIVLEWDQVLRAVTSALVSVHPMIKILGMRIIKDRTNTTPKEMKINPPKRLIEAVIRVLTTIYYGYNRTTTWGMIEDYLCLSEWHRNLSIASLEIGR